MLRTPIAFSLLLLCQVTFSQSKSTSWWTEPHRFLQFNLQVRDAPDIDAEEMIRYAKEVLRAEAIMLNAAGIYAWYPTAVPFHQKNPYMGDRDIFGELVAACRKYEVKILARTDWSKTTIQTYHEHPEWFVVNPDGEPFINTKERGQGWDHLVRTCGVGPYRNEAVAMPALQEVIKKYDVDAFFFSFAKFNPSHSPFAKEKYKRRYGEELPSDRKDQHPDWETTAYYDTWKNWYKAIKEVDPEVTVVGRTRLDQRETIAFMSEFSDVVSTQPRDAYQEGWGKQDPRWKASIETNFARGAHNNGERPLILTNTAPGLAWRHTALPKAEFDFWMAQIIANGGNWLPSTTGFPAVMEDKRTLQHVADFNRQIEKIQPYLPDNLKSAKVAILNKKANFRKAEDELNGFFEALINHQIQFDVISEYAIEQGKLDDYELLILANQGVLSLSERDAIAAFVRKGGKTIASYETGQFDESKNESSQVFLGQETGIRRRLPPIKDQMAAYMHIEDVTHPLFRNLGATTILPSGEDIMIFQSNQQPLLTHIPPFAPDERWGNPPERASFREYKTNLPLVQVTDDHVYFACQIGKLAWAHRLPDHQRLIANAITTLVPEAAPVKTINYEKVMVNLFRKDQGYLIFLVNNTGERPMQQVVTLKDLRVHASFDKKITSMKALLADQQITFDQQDEFLTFSLEELNTWEVIYAE